METEINKRILEGVAYNLFYLTYVGPEQYNDMWNTINTVGNKKCRIFKLFVKSNYI